jgi:hypothetical protein
MTLTEEWSFGNNGGNDHNPNCLNHILFSNEATFRLNGFVVNRHFASGPVKILIR